MELSPGEVLGVILGGGAILIGCFLWATSLDCGFWKHGTRYWRVERKLARREWKRENRT